MAEARDSLPSKSITRYGLPSHVWIPRQASPATALKAWAFIPPETEATHLTHILEPYAGKHGLSANEVSERYNNGTLHEPELDEYFLHDRAVRDSGHELTYRLEKRCANLFSTSTRSISRRQSVRFSATSSSSRNILISHRSPRVSSHMRARTANGPEGARRRARTPWSGSRVLSSAGKRSTNIAGMRASIWTSIMTPLKRSGAPRRFGRCGPDVPATRRSKDGPVGSLYKPPAN